MYNIKYAVTKNCEDQASVKSRGNDVIDHQSSYERLEGTFNDPTKGFVPLVGLASN